MRIIILWALEIENVLPTWKSRKGSEEGRAGENTKL